MMMKQNSVHFLLLPLLSISLFLSRSYFIFEKLCLYNVKFLYKVLKDYALNKKYIVKNLSLYIVSNHRIFFIKIGT